MRCPTSAFKVMIWLSLLLSGTALVGCTPDGDDGSGDKNTNNGDNNGDQNNANNGDQNNTNNGDNNGNNGDNNGGGCQEDADCAGGEACQEGACVPIEAGCQEDLDCRGGQVCRDNACIAIECVNDGECGEGEACVGGICEPEAPACEPGAARCEGDTLLRCSALGVEIPQTCQDGTECREDAPGEASCAPLAPLCEAGTRSCLDERTALICDDTGFDQQEQPCAEGEVCQDGACVAESCEPFAIGCLDDHTAFACDEAGTLSQLPCRQGQLCRDAACLDIICEPEAVTCDGGVVVTCNADGTQERREDCALTEACQDNPNGCLCQEGACVPRVCSPGSSRCQGDAVERCSDDGTAWEEQESCAQDQLCLGGLCLDADCEPGARACANDALLACGDDGRLTVEVDCAAQGQLCDALQSTCVPRACDPGATTCEGAVLRTCNRRGSGFDEGRDCEQEGLSCRDGACVDECTPGVRRCEDNVAYACDPNTLQEVATECAGATVCREGLCQALVCTPGEISCDGDVIATCDEDGGGFSPSGQDCAASGQRCRAGACEDGENQCPVAVARGGQPSVGVELRQGRAVLPAGAELLLIGEDSTDDDEVTRVEWTLLPGSAQGVEISPSVDPRNAVATGLTPGQRYVFLATAYDSNQVASCESAQLEVYVADEGTLVFHMLWDNAQDPNPLDTSGSDMDIHLLHMQEGLWNQSPWDVYYANREPAWTTGDRGALLLDDTNGRGPETIVVNNPQDCQWYQMGLHYWRAQFGTATAQVHVFVEGQLAYELTTQELQQTREWMSVVAVQWPSGEVFPLEIKQADIPQGQRPQSSQAMVDSGLCGFPEDLLPPSCEDELGDLSTPELAFSYSAPLEELAVCEGEPDHFSLGAPEGPASLVLRYQTDPTLGGSYLELTNGAWETLQTVEPSELNTLLPVPDGVELGARVFASSPLPSYYGLEAWYCYEDRFDNLSQAQAAPLEAGTYEDLSHCGGDSWFSLELGSGDTVTLRLVNDSGERLDPAPRFTLYDPNGLALGVGSQQSDGVMLLTAQRVPVSGTYHVQLSSGVGNAALNYSLEVTTEEAPEAADLQIEVLTPPTRLAEGYHLLLDASVSNTGQSAAGVFFTGLYLSADDTWGPEDTLLDSIPRQNLGVGAGFSIIFDAVIPEDTATNDWWLCAVVDHNSQVEESFEDNNVQCAPVFITPSFTCEDSLEPNNSPEAARELEPGTYSDLTVCNPGEEDYFKICPEPGTTVGVDLFFIDDVGDVDVSIIDEITRVQLARGTSSSDDESVSVTFNGEGCALVRVFAFSNGHSNIYDMELDYSPRSTPVCVNDGAEPNDSRATATDLSFLEDNEGVICGLSDYDYYQTLLEPGEWEVCAVFSPQSPRELLSLGVYNSAGQDLGGLSAVNPCYSFNATGEGPELFYLEVTAGQESFTQVNYDLVLTPQP